MADQKPPAPDNDSNNATNTPNSNGPVVPPGWGTNGRGRRPSWDVPRPQGGTPAPGSAAWQPPADPDDRPATWAAGDPGEGVDTPVDTSGSGSDRFGVTRPPREADPRTGRMVDDADNALKGAARNAADDIKKQAVDRAADGIDSAIGQHTPGFDSKQVAGRLGEQGRNIRDAATNPDRGKLRRTFDTADEVIGAGVEDGVAGFLMYLKIPAPIAMKVGRYAGWASRPKTRLKMLGIQLGALLAVLILLLAGLTSVLSRDDAAPLDAWEQVDPDVAAAVQSAAKANSIPVNLLMGLAWVQTTAGRYSPYDTIDRDPSAATTAGTPVSMAPESSPAIGDANDDEQGLGMYLLRPDAVAEADINPQDVADASMFVASEMRRIAQALVDQGQPYPTTPEDGDVFWGAVVDQLPVVDSAAAALSCALPAGEVDAGTVIRSIASCEIGKRASLRLPVIAGEGDDRYLAFVTGSTAKAILVNDALSVAWSNAVRSQPVASWADVSKIKCDAKARGPVGLFPLTVDQAKKLGVTNRCDPVANVTAAVKLVLDDLKTVTPGSVDMGRPYAVEQRGWQVITGAIGSGDPATRFTTGGPYRPWQATSSCTTLMESSITAMLTNKALAAPLNALGRSAAPTPEEINAARALLLGDGTGRLWNDPRCGVGGRQPSEPQLLIAWAQTAVAYLQNTVELGLADPDTTNAVLTGIAIVGTTAEGSADPRRPWAPGDPMTVRLSNDPITIDYPIVEDPFEMTVSPFTRRVLDTAIWFGAMVPGDDRAGTPPQGLGGFGFTFGMPVGLALERVPVGELPVVTSRSALVPAETCGTGINQGRYLRADMNQRWARLCTDARVTGVSIEIVSAWRDMASQQSVYNGSQRSGDGFQSAARPGSSPHQRGTALDLHTSPSQEVTGLPGDAGRRWYWRQSMANITNWNSSKTYRYLHTVVGCYNTSTKEYAALAAPIDNVTYASLIDRQTPPCGSATLPIKRAQTYGVVPLCKGAGESWASPAAMRCAYGTMLGSGSSFTREPWHFDLGQTVEVKSGFGDAAACESAAGTVNWADKRQVAIAVKAVWMCVLGSSGFDRIAPQGVSGQPELYPVTTWFRNLADQISSEAVVVAYCESGLTPTAGAGKTYQGLFQMGAGAMSRGGGDVARVLDGAHNSAAAARLFVSQAGKSPWFGWGEWQVVNTTLGNKHTSGWYPAIPRFPAPPGHPQAGSYSNSGLPVWAINPSGTDVPGGSCGASAYKGLPW